MRASGILLPIASLPSQYGIGDLSKGAYDFIDMLFAAGQKYWQILPVGPTGYGDSPYQSFSTFAGNPYFIAPDKLAEDGLLTEDELKVFDFGNDTGSIDYGKLYKSRFTMLKKAFLRTDPEKDTSFWQFIQRNASWLEEYALYMAVKDKYLGKSWSEWPENIKFREPKALAEYREELCENVMFYRFIQYQFSKQWSMLKTYAEEKNIKIIGDLPIYVAFDSADTWANRELFLLDEKMEPKAVAGCPPDAFSKDGQLWGNPLYHWEEHKRSGYRWWMERIKHCFALYDVVRIDHFKGFDEFYSIPPKDRTAAHGHWEKGPGIDFFREVEKQLGKVDIIAEDLGYITDSVRALLQQSGYPGMKILEFAFDSREDSDYLPHNYNKNCIVYTGTHDNDTIPGWFESLDEEDRTMALAYMGLNKSQIKDINWAFIRLAQQSVAKTCIIPMQDYLGLGSESRINIPSTLGNNWKWRLKKGDFNTALAEKIRSITKIYGRLS